MRTTRQSRACWAVTRASSSPSWCSSSSVRTITIDNQSLFLLDYLEIITMNPVNTGPEVEPYIAPGSIGNMATHHTITGPTVQTSAHQIASPPTSFQPPPINFSQPPAPGIQTSPLAPSGLTLSQPPPPSASQPTLQLNQPQPVLQVNNPAQPSLLVNQPPPLGVSSPQVVAVGQELSGVEVAAPKLAQ